MEIQSIHAGALPVLMWKNFPLNMDYYRASIAFTMTAAISPGGSKHTTMNGKALPGGISLFTSPSPKRLDIAPSIVGRSIWRSDASSSRFPAKAAFSTSAWLSFPSRVAWMRIPALGTFPTFATDPRMTKRLPPSELLSTCHFSVPDVVDRSRRGAPRARRSETREQRAQHILPGLRGSEVERASGQQENPQRGEDEDFEREECGSGWEPCARVPLRPSPPGDSPREEPYPERHLPRAESRTDLPPGNRSSRAKRVRVQGGWART